MIPTVETFDTTPIQEGARVRYWNSAAKNVFDAIEVEPATRHFAGRMRRRAFGAVQLATVDSTAVAIQGLASSKLNGIYLLINERGSADMQQRGRRNRLLAGELTVLCAHEPYRLECSREHRTHVLYVPGHNLEQTLGDQIAVAHRGTESELLGAFIARLGNLGIDGQTPGNLLDTTLNLIRLTWPGPRAQPARANAAAWRERLRRHVEQHLGDPDLDADSVARHFGISSRYVQMIFARANTTLSQFILERRLQSVAERLRLEDHRRICDIALDAGFNDVSHFCRRFRERFGVSAREYRTRHCRDD
jgi:AraC-like DNA-binding protein